MRRRRIGTADRNGDPLDGIVNLWDVAIVLAVGFLVAALTAAGHHGPAHQDNMTIVTNPGTEQMQVIVKDGDQIKKLDVQNGAVIQGVGTLLGSFYTLADGTVVYVPSGTTPAERHARRAERPPRPRRSVDHDAVPTTTDYPTTNPYEHGGAHDLPTAPAHHHARRGPGGGAASPPVRPPSERSSSTIRSSSALLLKAIWMLPPRAPLVMRTGASRTP